MKDIKVHRGRRQLIEWVAQGEHLNQDFKYMISDARKIARSISAFANHSGGRLLIGVKDNGVIAGVRNEEDIYVVEQAAERYCIPPQKVEFEALSYDSGVTVIKASIAVATRLPVQVDEGSGVFKAYYRVADENIVAHPLMVRAWSETTGGATYGSDEVAVMEAVTDGADTPRAIALKAGLSMERAEDIIVKLTSLGLLEFAYKHPGFHIRVSAAQVSESML